MDIRHYQVRDHGLFRALVVAEQLGRVRPVPILRDQQLQTRAEIYTQVSTDKQEVESTSISTQETFCKVYTDKRGNAVLGVYSDMHTGAQYCE